MKKHSIIIIGVIVSIILLLLFVSLNYFIEGLLDLEVQWIGVALIPIIISLIIGRYITTIKGFGIELESRLDDPIGTFALTLVADSIINIPRSFKETSYYIDNLSSSVRETIRRLTFVQGKTEYYESDAVSFYLSQLPSLQFFEVVDDNDHFICLIPISVFKNNSEVNFHLIDQFISSLEQNRVHIEFSEVTISESVQSNESLITVLPKVRSTRLGTAPVVNEKKILLGIINEREVEKRIADAVLASYKKRGNSEITE